MKYYKLAGLFMLVLLIGSCKLIQAPHGSFSMKEVPPAPDYAELQNWAALPFAKDFADTVPQGFGLKDNQADAEADVFFLHPTTFKGSQWNAPLRDEKTNEKTDERVILNQATAFNGTARIFAPRYRQMTYYGFYSRDTSSKKKALMLAYDDLRLAFDYYLKNWNNGRPIILVGHSQGALLGMMMLKDIFSVDTIRPKLVVAYLPGWPVRKSKTGKITPCNSAEEVGCFVSWNTFAADKGPGKKGKPFYQKATCVNPISWQLEGDWSALPAHEGTLHGDFDEITDSLVTAKCEDGILRITTDQLPFPYKWANNFHIADINLFWMDIRENVARRWSAYQTINE